MDIVIFCSNQKYVVLLPLSSPRVIIVDLPYAFLVEPTTTVTRHFLNGDKVIRVRLVVICSIILLLLLLPPTLNLLMDYRIVEHQHDPHCNFEA